MSKMNIYNLAGEVVGQQEVNAGLFGVEVNPIVVQQVVRAQMANRRKPWAHTKTRSEVSGGGKKPWAQKHTGRARHGSIRSPIWKGGGVAFGPRNIRNYTNLMNQKTKQLALRMVLSDKAANNSLILVQSLTLPEVKTKQVAKALQQLPVKTGKVLFVLDKEAKNFKQSARNLPKVEMVGAESLNVYETLGAGTIIVPISALATMERYYASKAK